jgi:alkylation response protein AidB-like acyl-CoA dehydrogenase
MDFRLDEGQRALQDTIRRFCADKQSLDELGDREGRPLDRVVWAQLAEMGVFGVMADESRGGAGLGAVEGSIIAEQLGTHLVTGPVLWTMLGALLLDGAADGHRVVGGIDATGAEGDPSVVEHGPDIDTLLVLRPDGVYACEGADLPPLEPLTPLDPLTPVARLDAVPGGARVGDDADAGRLRLLGTVLSAAMLVGISEAALDVSRRHCLEREQFGVPVGSFQALKHLLADMFTRTSLARSAMFGAAAVYDDPEIGDPGDAADVAKVLAGDAALANARTSVQVLGGMGFTWEMPPHYLLKRAWVLEHGFGTGDAHALAISAQLEAEVR